MGRKTPKVLARVLGGDAQVERLTERYLELRRQAFRSAVDLVIELGEILRDVQERLGRDFGEWLERVGTTDRTARNYVALARLAEEQPRILQRWKELGPTKLYRIAYLPTSGRRSVLRTSRGETLADATDREFAEIVAPYVVRRRKVTADMRAHGLRMKVQAWTKAVRAARVSGIKDDDLRKGLREEIRALEKALETLRRAI